MKKFFIGLLAIAAAAGCAKEQNQGLEYTPTGENSYMAVNLRAPQGLTKADDGVYESDDSAERTIKTAVFMFFDASGNPYAVGNGTNCLTEQLNHDGNDEPNVEWTSEAVLVIEKTQTVDPAYVIAVLNAPDGFVTNYNAKSMKDVKEAVLTSFYNNSTDKHIVMSNSVYKSEAGEEMFEVELTAGNLADSEEAAKKAPVTIYVERVCSKVRVNGIDALLPVKADSEGTAMTDSENNEVYFDILGWEITNTLSQTGLKKNIDLTWTDTDLGFTWNDSPYFRSYWAVTDADLDPVHAWNWNDVTSHTVAYDYYFENTLASTDAENGVEVDETDETGNNYPQLLIAGKFVDKDGNDLDIAKWYGKLYTLADLKTEVAASLSLRIYVQGENGNKDSISPDDLDYYQVDDSVEDNRYECYLKVIAASESKTFVDGNGKALTLEQVNAELAKISPAQIWKEGAYYYAPIRHLGTEGKTGEYGMVRNHLYDITVTEVIGLGTPVYDADQIITPEKPEDDKYSYVAAKINVLAWRVVSQNVTLE